MCFNPRPAIARGATPPASGPCGRLVVSIRAPRLLAGRPDEPGQHQAFGLFQSAPRDCSRGDRWISAGAADSASFNPRPAIARGATANRHGSVRRGIVSIRAPRLLAGRLNKGMLINSLMLFQSAPRDCSRGDVDIRNLLALNVIWAGERECRKS